jgi:cellulose synthase (UDP-forming)
MNHAFRVFVYTMFALAGIAGLGVLLIVPLAWREQAILGGILIVAAWLLNNISRSQVITLALTTISVFCTLRYAYWRVARTWEGVISTGHLRQWDTVFVLLLLLAEFYAFTTLILGYFQTLRPLGRRPVALPKGQKNWPTVDVFIPTYNEPLGVVRTTVLAALALDYPTDKLRVFVLDDGRRQDFYDFAVQVGAGYLARDDNAHAKAGNINCALRRTSGEYVAIFDSDHIPTRSFLQATLGWFLHDSSLALVQTPHHLYSPDPFERNLGQFRKVPNEGELFHRMVQDGNDLWNASFFCGSCAVMRRCALVEIGGVAVETVTEDAHTALRLQRRGWSTAYINIPQAAGLATENLAAHIGQRIRWARGMVQILRIENPLLVSGLSWPQRLCYFNATTHFLCATPRLIFLTIPVVYLLFGKVNIYGYSLAIFAYALPHIVLSNLTNSRVQGRYRFSFWSEIYEAVLAPYIVFPTLLALINPRLGKFNVTSKGGIVRRSYFDRRIALPFLLLWTLNAAALYMAVPRYVMDPAHHDTVIINVVWTVYNLIILSVAASVAWERRQRRSQVRVDVHLRFVLVTQLGEQLTGSTTQLSLRGATAELDSRLRVDRGSNVRFVFQGRQSNCEIAAVVAGSSRQALRLYFPRLSLAQERELVDVLYARPEAWLSWRKSRPLDNPVRSLLHIFWLGLRGLVLLLPGLFTARDAPVSPHTSTRERKRVPVATVSILLWLSSLVAPPNLQGTDGSDTPKPAGTQAPTFHEEYQLREIAGPTRINLRGAGSTQQLFFDMPITKVVDRASLQLRYSTPAMLHSNEITLELTLNGTHVASLPLGQGTDLQAEIVLPTDLLITENSVLMQLSGRCVACADTREPWITIDPSSTLNLRGAKLALANDLSLLPAPFFDRSAQRAWSLRFSFSEIPDSRALEAASMVASWFGIYSDVRGVRFPVSLGELPEGNVIVFALRGSGLSETLALPQRHGPLIAMRDNPHDPYGKLLFICGDQSQDLVSAARALVTSTGFPAHTDAWYVPVSNPPPRHRPYDAPRWLRTDRLALIGTYTTENRLTLQGAGSINIYFRLPPDLYLKWQQTIALALDYSYGGVGSDARAGISVGLNGENVGDIHLPPADLQTRRSDTVEIPTGKLHPYTNTLTLEFYVSGNPESGKSRPYVAINRDSSLDLRGIPHSVVLPRLELFADAGYPFTEWADLSQSAVVMPEKPTAAEYEEVLDLAGFFGAQTGSPATAITLTEAGHIEANRDKNLVLIGDRESQPLLSQWAAHMPVDVSATEMQLNPKPTPSRIWHSQWPFSDEDRRQLAGLLESRVPLDLVVEDFLSPYRDNRSVVALVTRDRNNADAVASMFIPDMHLGPIYGGVATLKNQRFQSYLVGRSAYRTGDLTTFEKGAIFLFEAYWLIPAFVVTFAFMFSGWLRQATERVAARRLIPKGMRAHTL